MDARTLVWDGCFNVRDLGGHPTEDGRETRFRAFVRADTVRRLTDAGWAALADYGVQTIVDLRLHSELEDDPPGDVPIDVLHIPLFPELGAPEWEGIDEISNSTPDDVTRVSTVYLEFLERFRPRFGTVVSALARRDSGPVVVHCHAGKDRTGLVCALLLRLAAVPAHCVAEDYAVSERNLAADTDAWLAEAETDEERELRRRMAVSPAAAMLRVLEELDRRYGGADGYLTAAGVDAAERSRIRGRLLG